MHCMQSMHTKIDRATGMSKADFVLICLCVVPLHEPGLEVAEGRNVNINPRGSIVKVLTECAIKTGPPILIWVFGHF